MRRVSLFLSAAVFALTAAVFASAARDSPATARDGGISGRGSGYGRYFAVQCGFSHRNADDPIVYFKEPGFSHDHTFFGNSATNASTTPGSLLGGVTSCTVAADASAYWVPTLMVAGNPVTPIDATIYYLRRTTGRVQAFPAGLKIIAGNSKALSAQSADVTYWTCTGDRRGASSTIPNCGDGLSGSSLHLVVKFPNCWDGKSVDSADHKSHMAYASDRVCPKGFPVAVPMLAVVVRYPALPSGSVALSSGGEFSGHADFMNGWKQQTLERLVDRYLNGSVSLFR
jgi:hypothetical protein